MICLRCGHCCETLSPIGSPCPRLSYQEMVAGRVAVCALYPSQATLLIGPYRDDRPKQCRDHQYPHRMCPIGLIGLDVLHLDAGDGDGIAARGRVCREVV